MSKITAAQLQSMKLCYNPVTGAGRENAYTLPEDWMGSAIDILAMPVAAQDRLWVVFQPGLLEAEQALAFCKAIIGMAETERVSAVDAKALEYAAKKNAAGDTSVGVLYHTSEVCNRLGVTYEAQVEEMKKCLA